jgi:hypothetical protein
MARTWAEIREYNAVAKNTTSEGLLLIRGEILSSATWRSRAIGWSG